MPTRAHLCHLLVIVLALASPSYAQNRRDNANAEREPVRLAGTLKDMRGNIIQVEATDGQQWLVQIASRPEKISYVGTAEPNWIRPGMWVRFRGNFNQKLQSDSAISELTVFTPSDEVEIGINPEKTLGDNLFSDEPAEEAQPDKNAFIPCTVAGRIAAIKKNKLTIAAGRAAVTVEVVDDVRIAVEVADLSVAQAGDQVELQGWKYAMVPGRAMANQLTVTGDKPLTTAKPKRGKPDGKKDEKKDEKKKGGEKAEKGDEPSAADDGDDAGENDGAADNDGDGDKD